MILKWDGHAHTKFCYHGNDAPQERYLDRAIELGFERYTITEHPPLPDRWVNDERLMDELAMPMSELPQYMAYVQQMKWQYEGRLEVTVGLELDYLHGSTSFMDRIVDQWQHVLEDVVCSVHYLPGHKGMRCIDFTPDDFREGILAYYGTMNNVIEEYFNHIEALIEWAKPFPMRKRLGHIQLIEKFRQVLPEFDDQLMEKRIRALLPKLVDANFGLDVNTAGLRVATCGKPYVPEWLLRETIQLGIPCIYGSDAHKPDHVGFGWDWYEEMMKHS